jgi:hypothetical protein
MTFCYGKWAATIVLLAWVQGAVAQQDEKPRPGPVPVSDAEVKTFAGIVAETRRIADAYNAKRDAAQTVREQQQVELAASDELTRAVTQEGMTVERYQEILKQTLSDPDLSARVKQHVKEAQK